MYIELHTEPLIHSFATDCLPKDHPWAHKTVWCGGCNAMVHAFNNECMTDWVEWGGKALCWVCVLPTFETGPDDLDFQKTASKFPCVDNGD